MSGCFLCWRGEEEKREVAEGPETLGGSLSLALGLAMYFLSSKDTSCIRQKVHCVLHQSGSPITIEDAAWGCPMPTEVRA